MASENRSKGTSLKPEGDDPRRVREVFNQWAAAGRALGMERSHGPMARVAFEHLGVRDDSRYLDVGCGNGYTVRWAAQVAQRGLAVGIDASPEMVSLAESRSREYPNAEFHVAEFPDHPLERGTFDAIFSMEVLYYLPDLAGALREIRELLAPGGRFACVVDFYQENSASHSWPQDVGLEMTLLDGRGWCDRFQQAGFVGIRQERIRVPKELASAEWKVTEGSLVTYGSR